MSVRLPQNLSNPLEMSKQENVLAYEINQEKAQTLGALGRRLARTLTALKNDTQKQTYEDRLEDAAEALYEFIVFREACGLTGTNLILDVYEVPANVRSRMGPKITKP